MWLPRMKAKPQVIIRPKGIGNFSSKILFEYALGPYIPDP